MTIVLGVIQLDARKIRSPKRPVEAKCVKGCLFALPRFGTSLCKQNTSVSRASFDYGVIIYVHEGKAANQNWFASMSSGHSDRRQGPRFSQTPESHTKIKGLSRSYYYDTTHTAVDVHTCCVCTEARLLWSLRRLVLNIGPGHEGWAGWKGCLRLVRLGNWYTAINCAPAPICRRVSMLVIRYSENGGITLRN